MIDIQNDNMKDKMIDDVGQTITDARLIGQMVDKDNERIEGMNKRLDGMANKGERTNRKMQNLL